MVEGEEYGGAGGNVIVDGLPYGFGAGRSPGRLDHAGLDGHGLRDGGFLCGAGDGDVLPPGADAARPGAGGELPCCWCFHAGISGSVDSSRMTFIIFPPSINS